MKYKKLYLDCNPIEQPEGTYRYAKNMVRHKRAIFNENGFQFQSNFPSQTIIGTLPIINTLVIFFLKSNIGAKDQIALYDVEGKNIVQQQSDNFGFDINYPIQAEFFINAKEEYVVTWVDGLNPPRIMNITAGYKALKDTLLFPIAKLPDLIDVSIQDGSGELLSGTHQIAIAYANQDGTQTNYSFLTAPEAVTDKIKNSNVNQFDGVEPSIITNKGLSVSIYGVDNAYDNVVVALVSTINGITTAKQVKTVPIPPAPAPNNVFFLIQGNENEGALDLNSILVKISSYRTGLTITQADDNLLIGNLTQDQQIQFQTIANNISINYETKLVNGLNYYDLPTEFSNPKYDARRRGFQHGEVYAFYIAFILPDLTYSRAFHIPGRVALPGEKNLISSLSSGTPMEQDAYALYTAGAIPSDAKYYEVLDTSTNLGNNYGLMSYWENRDEQYPIDPSYGSLQGQNVRHHKFPTIRFCKNNHYSSDPTYGIYKLDTLGIKVSNIDTSSITNKIVGYEIFYAKRTIDNSSKVGQSLLQFEGIKVPDTSIRLSSGGNWTIQNQQFNKAFNRIVYGTDYVRFYTFDNLINKPAINPTYYQIELGLRATSLLRTIGSRGKIMDGNPDDNNGREIYGINIDYTVYDATGNGVIVTNAYADSNLGDSNTFREITDFQYLPFNNSLPIASKTINNNLTEETVFARNYRAISFISPQTFKTGTDTSIANSCTDREDTVLVNLCQYKRNVYSPFNNQPLVSTNYRQTNNVNSSVLDHIFGGDTFVSIQSYITYAPISGTDGDISNKDSGIFINRQFIGETIANAGLRHSTNDIYTKFTPKEYPLVKNVFSSSGVFFAALSRDHAPNNIQYNKDYSIVNEQLKVFPFNHLEQFTTNFQDRIIKTKKQQRDSTKNNWKRFLPNDFFDQPRDNGDIINIQGDGSEVIIHHEFSVYKTRSKTKLPISDNEVTLGAGDIFDIDPEEILTVEGGYGGTQHRLACVMTKYGYVFVNALKGKVFLLKGKQLEELSSDGLYNFFYNLGLSNATGVNGDNPFLNQGITIAYDERYDRLLLSASNPIWTTLSYSFNQGEKGWTSFHDYTPSYMFDAGSNIYSLVYDAGNGSTALYKNNIGNKGNFPHIEEDINLFPSFIVVVFNQYTKDKKLFFNVNFIANLYNANGVVRRDKTITTITAWNNYQNSGEIILIPFSTVNNIYNQNLRLSKSTWNFSHLRDVVIDLTQPSMNPDFTINNANINNFNNFVVKKNLIDNFMFCKLLYDNSDNQDLYIEDIDCKFNLVPR